jgi:hypothetical protein
LEGEAHGRSGASRAGRTGGGSREGGSQTSHVARGGRGICRPWKADPPVRDCVVGHETPGEAASRDESRVGLHGPTAGDAAVRGCCGMSLEGHESAGRAEMRLRSRIRMARRTNTRRASKRLRVGRKPIAVLVRRVRVLGAPRNPRRGGNGPPRGGDRPPRQPSILWRATSTKDADSLVRVC